MVTMPYIPYIVSGVGSRLVCCHMAVCSLYIYKALYPYVTRGPDERYYELTKCRLPTLSVQTVTEMDYGECLKNISP